MQAVLNRRAFVRCVGCGAELAGARRSRRSSLDAQADVADRRAVHQVGGMGKALAFGVDDEVDAALAPQGDVRRLVLRGLAEAEGVEQRTEFGSFRLVGVDFKEVDRKSVGLGTSVSERVGLGGGMVMKK